MQSLWNSVHAKYNTFTVLRDCNNSFLMTILNNRVKGWLIKKKYGIL